MVMNCFSLKWLNRCASGICILMLLSVPVLMGTGLYWMSYIILAAGGIAFLMLFFAYERKVTDFLDKVNENMDQMLSARGSEKLPQVQDSESTFARFVSKLSRLYDALRLAQTRAEDEKSAMQGVIADLSHQIRTPVANIKMDLELLTSRKMSQEKQREFLERTLHQADKMDFLIQSVIKMSRLESGAIQLAPQYADLAQTLANALLSISAQAGKKKMEIAVECPQPFMVRHDPKWTEEAIFNLLDNAVKYTPENGSIQIRAEMREAGAYLSVSDNGRGIPEEWQGAVFSKFFRAPDVHNMPGAGVGLYLTRQILEAQGGYVMVKSVCGRGSTFSIQFL